LYVLFVAEVAGN